MENADKVSRKFDELIAEGKSILAASGWDGHEYHHRHPNEVDYKRFRTESLNIIRRACGINSDHYQELLRIATDSRNSYNSYYMKDCFGILEAAKRDFEGGYLFEIRALISSELLGDFLEQAEFLFENGYFVPAASLTGAILEDTLRKLCERSGIVVAEKTNIEKLNVELTKAGIYDKLIQKRVTAFADIRNNADHGHFNKFNKEDVNDMVRWIRRFASDYLGK
ncbi:MAG: hypothetical protein JW803_01540 [Endomicrobiales bacterium]|nr:hypothetical protein [Endomicrobiales bacterium]